ncbi:MAG: glycogen/starch synthase, partial [Anaerolineales bacterium]|nr:glycogen/starch synthase [Anaerolineales bacterium]
MKSSCIETAIEGTPCHLIGGWPIAPGESVYTQNAAIDKRRSVFFALAAMQHAHALGFQPDVVHVHDAHPGAALHWLQQAAGAEPFWRETARVLTIHNMVYQYNEAAEALARGSLKPTTDNRVPTWARAGLLALAIRSADRINAVSPTYAKEILTQEHGAGLHPLLLARARRLSGILNGIDYQRWDAATDSALARN